MYTTHIHILKYGVPQGSGLSAIMPNCKKPPPPPHLQFCDINQAARPKLTYHSHADDTLCIM